MASPASETELGRLAAGGDAGAFHALVDRHSPALMRLALWLVGNRADAEDAVQEALVAAFKAVRSFDGRSTFKTWVTRILIRQAGRVRERARRHKGLPLAGGSHAAGGGGGREVEPAVDSPAGRSDKRMDLAAAIDALPDDHREIILLREVQGLAYEEIAQALGVPRGTVESRLFRARAALRERLKSYGWW